MEKTSIGIGAVFGAAVAIIAFAILFSPPIGIQPSVTIDEGSVADAQNVDDVQIAAFNKLSLVQIFERSEPGVVQINVKKETASDIDRGLGSGFVYDARGHIITNAHVIKNAKEVIVTFLDGRSYVAQIIGTDEDTDLSVMRVEANRSILHPLPMGDSSKLKIGEPVAAIGNPFGLSGSMTSGIISQMGRLLPQESGFLTPDIIQTDAAINPGNSGGPLINMKGQVVGVNTAIQSTTGEFTGVGFAVPSNTIQKIIPVLISEGKYEHPWLGVRGTDIGPDLAKIMNLTDARGFLIIDVIEDSPAFAAGLKGSDDTVEMDGDMYKVGGDLVLSVDGKEVRKIDDILIHLQREKTVGDTLKLSVLRDGEIVDLSIILEERPE